MAHLNHRRINVAEPRPTRNPLHLSRGCGCHPPAHTKRSAHKWGGIKQHERHQERAHAAQAMQQHQWEE